MIKNITQSNVAFEGHLIPTRHLAVDENHLVYVGRQFLWKASSFGTDIFRNLIIDWTISCSGNTECAITEIKLGRIPVLLPISHTYREKKRHNDAFFIKGSINCFIFIVLCFSRHVNYWWLRTRIKVLLVFLLCQCHLLVSVSRFTILWSCM